MTFMASRLIGFITPRALFGLPTMAIWYISSGAQGMVTSAFEPKMSSALQ